MRKCGGIIFSLPGDSLACECGNLFIYVRYRRIIVKHHSKMKVFLDEKFQSARRQLRRCTYTIYSTMGKLESYQNDSARDSNSGGRKEKRTITER
jgi:hypothetical protein